MKTKYTLKNFRVFDNNGATFDLKPITILTGANSSGKSSMVKSLVLVESFLEKGKNIEDCVLHSTKLDFTVKPNSLLGNFKKVIHHNSDSDVIEMEFLCYSSILYEDVWANFSFVEEDNVFGNGILKSYTIKNLNGATLYSTDPNISADRNLLIDRFFNFLRFNNVYNERIRIVQEDFQGTISKERIINKVNSIIRDIKAENKKINSYVYQQDLLCKTIDISEHIFSRYKKNGLLYDLYVLDTFDNVKREDVRKVLSELLKEHTIEGDNDDICKETSEDYDKTISNEPSKTVKLHETLEDIELKRYISVPNKIYSTHIDFVVNKICTDFENSKFNSFLDYYKDYEMRALKSNIDANKHYLQQLQNCNFAIENNFEYYSSSNYMYEHMYHKTYNSKEELSRLKNSPVDFWMIYDLMSRIEISINPKSEILYRESNPISPVAYTYIANTIENKFYKFVDSFAQKLYSNIKDKMNLSYISSSIVKQQRTYTLDFGDDFSCLLKKYWELKYKFENPTPFLNKNKKGFYDVENEWTDGRKNETFIPGCIINEWFKKFEIGESVDICIDSDGLVSTIYINKDKEKKTRTLLADEGYGITQIFVILLRIETAILQKKILGFGRNYTVAIEEPEVHLHPKFQSLLADMFVQIHKQYDIDFIVETHSEYLIRKLQTLVAKQEVSTEDISVIYVENPDPTKRPKYIPQVRQINIKDNGKLADKFGTGFFDESSMLSTELLTANIKKQ